jgi:glycosyltransferase involved in cell wall biosynthesis
MKIAAIIPCYRVRGQVAEVVAGALERVDHVFVVDDCCPEGTGDLVESTFSGAAVTVLRHDKNKGVGGATITGYKTALAAGYDVLVKIDGDGQMDLDYLPALIQPIISGEADYTKGNRFYRKRFLQRMPVVRLLGNSMLSMLNKASSGYWNLMDPTNGYTALSRVAAREIEWWKVANGYFFESDLLFRLNISRAVVQDVPIPARYGQENSSLSVYGAIPRFLLGHVRNVLRRYFYNYLLRDFSVGTVHSLLGAALFLFGVIFGIYAWSRSIETGQDATVGTVMLATLPIILGFQLLLAALSFDIANIPTKPLQRILAPPAEHKPVAAVKTKRLKESA